MSSRRGLAGGLVAIVVAVAGCNAIVGNGTITYTVLKDETDAGGPSDPSVAFDGSDGEGGGEAFDAGDDPFDGGGGGESFDAGGSGDP